MEELKTKPITQESLEKNEPKQEEAIDNGDEYYRLPKFSEVFDPLKPKKLIAQHLHKVIKKFLKEF